MSTAVADRPLILPGLTGLLRDAAQAALAFVHEVRPGVRARIS